MAAAVADGESALSQARDDASAAEMYESWNSAAALVHRIQRERGATCAWVASRIAKPSLNIVQMNHSNALVIDFRKRTNACIAAGLHRMSPAASAKLREVRELADPAGSARSDSSSGMPARGQARTFCLVFSKYTELVSELLGEGLLKKEYGCVQPPTVLPQPPHSLWTAAARIHVFQK
jgi:hypothetical protein